MALQPRAASSWSQGPRGRQVHPEQRRRARHEQSYAGGLRICEGASGPRVGRSAGRLRGDPAREAGCARVVHGGSRERRGRSWFGARRCSGRHRGQRGCARPARGAPVRVFPRPQGPRARRGVQRRRGLSYARGLRGAPGLHIRLHRGGSSAHTVARGRKARHAPRRHRRLRRPMRGASLRGPGLAHVARLPRGEARRKAGSFAFRREPRGARHGARRPDRERAARLSALGLLRRGDRVVRRLCQARCHRGARAPQTSQMGAEAAQRAYEGPFDGSHRCAGAHAGLPGGVPTPHSIGVRGALGRGTSRERPALGPLRPAGVARAPVCPRLPGAPGAKRASRCLRCSGPRFHRGGRALCGGCPMRASSSGAMPAPWARCSSCSRLSCSSHGLASPDGASLLSVE